MAQQDNIRSVKLIKKNGKLVHKEKHESLLFKNFVKDLEENQVVEVFFDAYKDDGSNVQIAKIHVCIKKLAIELGYTVDEMKLIIKKQSGLYWEGKDNAVYTKSFADCSKEELSLVLEVITKNSKLVNITI